MAIMAILYTFTPKFLQTATTTCVPWYQRHLAAEKRNSSGQLYQSLAGKIIGKPRPAMDRDREIFIVGHNGS